MFDNLYAISSFPNLVTLEGMFPSLTTLTGAMAVSDNPSLVSITNAFPNLIGEDITTLSVFDNDVLPQSQVDEFETQLTNSGFVGATFISGNGPG